jgi:hypothetical protein
MNRREFLATSGAALVTALVADSIRAFPDEVSVAAAEWRPLSPFSKNGPAPKPEITAAVNVIVPADPDVPGDFKGSDYHADWIVAATLGDLGQTVAVVMLNKYARRVAGRKFMACDDGQRLNAVKAWLSERETLQPLIKEMLSGLLTISMVGTYENNTPEENDVLFANMGWYDPADPDGTFHLPLEGYPDSYQFPVKLKKGLR